MYFTFKIDGIHCQSCKLNIETEMKKLNYIENINLNIINNNLYIETKIDVSKDEIVHQIQKLGYKVVSEKKDKNNIKLFIFNLISFCLIMYLSMYSMLNLPSMPIIEEFNYLYNVGIQFLVSILVIIFNKKIFINGFKNIKRPNMNTLILVSTLAIIIQGIISIIYLTIAYITKDNDLLNKYHHSIYLEAIPTIIFFISLGNYFVKKAKYKSDKTTTVLLSLKPKSATIIDDDGSYKVVDAISIKENDVLLIKSGQVVPNDGIIIDGTGYFDDSKITGESNYILKNVGDIVYAGSYLVDNTIKIKSICNGNDNTIYKIIKKVEEASFKKTKIETLVDKISLFFTPLVIIISLLSFLINFIIFKDFNHSINIFLSVLLIACPCALGLATPLAISIASYNLSKNGILIKDSIVFEKFSNINKIYFDKTGTLTTGEFKVISVNGIDDYDMNNIINIELNSNHKIANSIVNEYLNKEEFKFLKKDVENIKILSNSIEGKINDDLYKIGSIKSFNLDSEFIKNKENGTIIVVFKNNEYLGYIDLIDSIKDGIKDSIKYLKANNVIPYIITGDNEKSCKRCAKILEIENIYYDMMPDDKLKIINDSKINQYNKFVCMGGRWCK